MKTIKILIAVVILFVGFTLFKIDKVKAAKSDKIALSIKYYDNARLYKIDTITNKFYLIGDLKKKQIA